MPCQLGSSGLVEMSGVSATPAAVIPELESSSASSLEQIATPASCPMKRWRKHDVNYKNMDPH